MFCLHNTGSALRCLCSNCSALATAAFHSAHGGGRASYTRLSIGCNTGRPVTGSRCPRAVHPLRHAFLPQITKSLSEKEILFKKMSIL